MSKLKVLDLFSGIGGFSLGLERTGGFETVAFCEIEEFPRKVLKKHWPEVPCYHDVRELKGAEIGTVDLICGGYPCQPFSTAGKRRGKDDDRHLWPEFMRLVAELRPSWVIGENVAGHISMGLDDVLSDLEREGYAARTFVIPACAKGAYHRRDRCWTIAHANDLLHSRELDVRGNKRQARESESGNQFQGQASHGERLRPELSAGASLLAHAKGERWGETGQLSARRSKRTAGTSTAPSHVSDPECIGRKQVVTSEQSGSNSKGPTSSIGHRNCPRGWEGWLPEPNVGRVVDGVPNRVDRLRALGNAVVPQIPEMIGYAILEAEAA